MPRPPTGAGTRQPVARGGRGAFAPGGIDTASTGNVGGDLAKAIINTMQANRQNAAANALMNQGPTGQPGGGVTQNLGHLPLSGGAPQDFTLPTDNTGFGPNVGSLVHTGGMGELALRQQQAQQDAAQRTADLNEQYKRAQLAHTLAQTTALTTPKPTKLGKPAPYVAGSGDVQNDPTTDNFNQIAADFNAQHGKDAYNVFTRNLSNLQPDGKGNLVLMRPATPDEKKADPNTPDNVPVTDKNGLPAYSIPATDAGYWGDRYNAARLRSGQGRLGPMPDGVNPNSGDASGSSQINPIAVTTPLQARALPAGTWAKFPDGSVRQINRSAAQAQSTATPGTVSSVPTSEEPSTGEPSTEEES